jgi:hypothetical protein
MMRVRCPAPPSQQRADQRVAYADPVPATPYAHPNCPAYPMKTTPEK